MCFNIQTMFLHLSDNKIIDLLIQPSFGVSEHINAGIFFVSFRYIHCFKFFYLIKMKDHIFHKFVKISVCK